MSIQSCYDICGMRNVNIKSASYDWSEGRWVRMTRENRVMTQRFCSPGSLKEG